MAVEKGLSRPPALAVALATTALLLGLAELGGRSCGPTLAASEWFHDPGAMKALAERPRDGRPMLWVLGDSTVLGFDVPREQGIGPQLQRALDARGGDWEVRAVGVAGVGIAGAAALLDGLPAAPGDRVLIPIHLGIGADATGAPPAAGSLAWQASLETELADELRGRSWLVRNADYLSRLPVLALKNGLLPEALAARLRPSKPGAVRRREWTSGELAADDLDHLEQVYGALGPERTAALLERLADARDRLARRGAALVSFVTPLNRELFDRYGIARWADLERVAADTCAGCADLALPCVDLLGAVDGALFFDDDHVMGEGYAALAARLAAFLAPELAGGHATPPPRGPR